MPKVRCQYDEDKMKDAMEAVKMGLSGRAAAEKFDVPRTTLMSRLSGKSSESTKLGRNTVLSESQEEIVVEWILKCRKRGMQPSKDSILNSIQAIINSNKRRKTPFTNNRPGKTWLQLFMGRHPILGKGNEGLSSGESMAQEADGASTSSKSMKTKAFIRSWFAILKEELERMNLLDILKDPSRVFCSDEFNIELCPKTGRVIGTKAWQNVYELPSGPDKSTMSFLRTFCANGEIACPGVFYPNVRVPSEVMNAVPEDFYVGLSDSGWIKAETFMDFLEYGLIDWLNVHDVQRPIILFVDGKTTHITVQLSNFCEKNEIILFLIPNNALDILHPARGIKSFESSWKEAVEGFQLKNPTSSIRRVDVAPLLSGLLAKIDKDSISGSFARSGLCPLNPDVVDYLRSTGKKHRVKKTEETNCTAAQSVSQSHRYLYAKSVMMELLSKNQMSLVKKNQGDKGLVELWSKINAKIESESMQMEMEEEEEDYGHEETSVSYEICNVPPDNDEVTEEVVIALEPVENYN